MRRQSVGGGPWEWAQSIRKARMVGREGRTGAELGLVGGSQRGRGVRRCARDRATTAQILDFVRRQKQGWSPAWRGQMSSLFSNK